ncbi:MAG: efflux transporter outer membrane subunit [Thermoguttaceae bacterium]|jgi:NodT family efflux transporter outer membrane factor (OMF) lipoprotein
MDALLKNFAENDAFARLHGGSKPWRPLLVAGLVLAFTTIMGGCSCPGQWWHNGFKVGPNYCPPSASVAESWIETNDPRLRGSGRDNACWWTTFGDPTLNQLVAEASQQNLTLKMAGCRILGARAESGIAEGNLFPQQQQMTAQYSRNAMSATAYPFNVIALPEYYYNNWSAGFNAAWELDFWGRFRRAIEAADAHLNAQVEGYDNVLVLLQAEVATNYIQMRSYEERIELARKNLELQQDTLRITTLRERQGLVTELDVQQATTNLGATDALIPILLTGHRKAQNRLCILMGEPPHELTQKVKSPGSIPFPPHEVIVGIPAELLRRRPDVRQAERDAAAQSARIGIAEAEFYPHIAITGTIGLQAEHMNQLFESSSLAGAIGPGISWNILNYGRIKNNVRAEDARFQQAVLNYRDTVLHANEEVENGIVAFLNEQDRVKSLDKSTRAAARSVELAMLQYQKGLIAYQPLLDSERALVQQQDGLAESRGAVGMNLVAVYKALGGGWQARLPSNQPQTEPVSVPVGEPVPPP